jgi:hypothetical protein
MLTNTAAIIAITILFIVLLFLKLLFNHILSLCFCCNYLFDAQNRQWFKRPILTFSQTARLVHQRPVFISGWSHRHVKPLAQKKALPDFSGRALHIST